MERDLYGEEHEAFRGSVRTFVEREVMPNLERWDEDRLTGRDVWLVAGRHGGYGYMNEYPIARAYRDARVQKIYGGTNEIMNHIIARNLIEIR
jgi:alkylation response protein AidB-like acyl-CoA dehydrogenase